MKNIHLQPYLHKDISEAGCDEAGRGCLAGPVCAAAVILPSEFYHPLLNDSKQMTKQHRDELREVIETAALSWSVAMVSAEEIDRLNILRASITAMHRALDGLTIIPEFILVDGNKFYPYKNIPHQCVIGGDAAFTAIAAASVLAKTHRDEYMCALASEYPNYEWDKNAGYPTEKHRAAIIRYGVTPHHRKSFRLINEQLELF